MKVKPLSKKLENILKKYSLSKKYLKQKTLLEQNPHYPSLKFELLKETKDLNPQLYSFRLDSKYRAICIKLKGLNEVEVISFFDHYERPLK